MIWVGIILVAIFVLPTILGIVLGVKSLQITGHDEDDVDPWTMAAIWDMHNKYQERKKK